MRRVAILGYPLGHSLSPIFQNAAFAAEGLEITYEARATPPDQLAGEVARLRDAEMVGANITIPHKEAVIPLLDRLEPLAARIGAVNTIVHEAGRLTGHNTDGPGFVEALRRQAAFDPRGARILLLGAGGAARGIAFALVDAGASSIGIWNRTAERASRLVADLVASGAPAMERGSPHPGGFACVVNCTSAGMSGGTAENASPCDLSMAEPGTLAVDIVYRPAETPFLRQALAAGLPVLDGLPMLIYQGAIAFELWTGRQAPVEVMFAAARGALATP